MGAAGESHLCAAILLACMAVVRGMNAAIASEGFSRPADSFWLPRKSGGSGTGNATVRRIFYRGGPVMADPVTLYPIFYGTWNSRGCGVRVITELLRSISSTAVVRRDNQGAPLHAIKA